MYLDQYLLSEKLIMRRGGGGLDPYIRWVLFTRTICQLDNTLIHIFPNPIIGYIILIFIKSAIINRKACNNDLVVSNHEGQTIDRNPNYSELVAYLHV